MGRQTRERERPEGLGIKKKIKKNRQRAFANVKGTNGEKGQGRKEMHRIKRVRTGCVHVSAPHNW